MKAEELDRLEGLAKAVINHDPADFTALLCKACKLYRGAFSPDIALALIREIRVRDRAMEMICHCEDLHVERAEYWLAAARKELEPTSETASPAE